MRSFATLLLLLALTGCQTTVPDVQCAPGPSFTGPFCANNSVQSQGPSCNSCRYGESAENNGLGIYFCTLCTGSFTDGCSYGGIYEANVSNPNDCSAVTGSVHQAGMFPVTGRLTLLQAVTLAHGPDENANPHRVAVFRMIQGQRMAAAFDLASIGRGQAEDPRIYAGDIIVVDGSKVKSAWTRILQAVPFISFLPALGL